MDKSLISQIYFIEELAANAWPAAVVQVVDGWRLRFNWNVTRRANSVWPNGVGQYHTLEQKLAWVEEFYARQSCPARYQICPAAQPADLNDILAERGYTTDARTAVQTATIETLLSRTKPTPAYRVNLTETYDDAWFAAYCRAEAVNPQAAEGRRNILARIGPRAGYALLQVEGYPAGMGLAVMERGWVGIFSMATEAEFRRRGLATVVMRSLAEWGKANGATQLYLQVMENNGPAQALYRKLGFETLYHYHYRQRSG
jgi:ribosomal protein S18 acetylase RimI-like enzyme